MHRALAARSKVVWIFVAALFLCILGAVAALVTWGNPFGGSGQSPESVPAPLARQLADRFAPVLRLAAREPFEPLDRPRYLKVADLMEVSPSAGRKEIEAPTVAELPVRDVCGEGCRIFLDLDESTKLGGHRRLGPYKRLEPQALPPGTQPTVYYHATHYTPSGDYTVQYWFLYLFNHFPFDNHESDWEESIVRVDQDQHPQEVFFSTHSRGITKAWDHVTHVGDHPVLYVALGSHANYPSTGGDGTQSVLVACKAVLRRVACFHVHGAAVEDRTNGCGDTLAPADVTQVPRSPREERLCRRVAGGAGSSAVVHYSLARLGWPAFVGNYGPYTKKLFRDPQRRRVEWGSPLDWLESVRGR